MKLVRYKNNHYSTIFNPSTGFFARIEDPGHPEPFWSPFGPELIDVSITNWCDKNCPFCYRHSDQGGVHMTIEDYEHLMEQARDLNVMQVALGGGNPNQHPDFCRILAVTRDKYGIVPNFTTNGRGLTPEILGNVERYCGAVAVSAYHPYYETRVAVEQLVERGITCNIHFLLSAKSVTRAIEWLENPPDWLVQCNAIIFLNYKPIGRFVFDDMLLNRSCHLGNFFKLATTSVLPFRVGFDTCSITGLARLGSAHPSSLEGCDSARFSLFVSEQLRVYPCSFMVEGGYEGVSLREYSLKEIWRNHPDFVNFRKKHLSGGCSDCQTQSECLSGCPLFPKMNLCPSKCVDQSSA